MKSIDRSTPSVSSPAPNPNLPPPLVVQSQARAEALGARLIRTRGELKEALHQITVLTVERDQMGQQVRALDADEGIEGGMQRGGVRCPHRVLQSHWQ